MGLFQCRGQTEDIVASKMRTGRERDLWSQFGVKLVVVTTEPKPTPHMPGPCVRVLIRSLMEVKGKEM